MFIIYMTIYNIIIYCIQPIIWIRLLWCSLKIPEYRQNCLERYGFYNKKNIKPNDIVIHAVSVGETMLAISIIQALLQYHPKLIITLTVMTPSGFKLANQITLNYNIQCIYLPYDLPGSMKRFIKKIKPKLVIIIETELWPNLINILYQNKIPCIIANARLSLYSFIKYKKISYFFSSIIKRITIIAARNKQDAYRFLKLGFKKQQLYIIGNLKFDIVINPNLFNKILFLKKNWVKNRLTWIASSTHAGEEILLLNVHKQLLTIFPNLLMILAPRHPERFSNVINIVKQSGLSYITKSNEIIPAKNIQVMINDTIGELMLLYGISDIAFIGGSLVAHGGHNPLEPAIFAIPIIMGPYTFNFTDICSKLHRSNGLISINNSKSLVHIISMLLKNPEKRLYHGNCAAKVFQNNQGALQKLLYLIYYYLPH